MANYDPNSNRMLTKDLGCTNQGCKCQSKWLILWQDGEIIEYNTDDCPQLLHNLNNDRLESAGVEKREDGQYYYNWDTGFTFDGEDIPPSPLEIVEVNGNQYFRDSCESFGEVASCARDLYLERELKDKPNGYYIVMMEFACFTTYNYEGGYEGDNEHAFVILNDEPISEDQIDSINLDDYEVK